jgi:hypothetical protein
MCGSSSPKRFFISESLSASVTPRFKLSTTSGRRGSWHPDAANSGGLEVRDRVTQWWDIGQSLKPDCEKVAFKPLRRT